MVRISDILISVVLYAEACFARSGAMQGWLVRNLSVPIRMALLITSIIIMLPGTWFDLIGAAVFAVLLLYLLKTKSKNLDKPAAA